MHELCVTDKNGYCFLLWPVYANFAGRYAGHIHNYCRKRSATSGLTHGV